MPEAIFPVMAETGSAGIRRGRVKFKMTATINVMTNHRIFFPKYFR